MFPGPSLAFSRDASPLDELSDDRNESSDPQSPWREHRGRSSSLCDIEIAQVGGSGKTRIVARPLQFANRIESNPLVDSNGDGIPALPR
jgi:hypothetical protein